MQVEFYLVISHTAKVVSTFGLIIEAGAGQRGGRYRRRTLIRETPELIWATFYCLDALSQKHS